MLAIPSPRGRWVHARLLRVGQDDDHVWRGFALALGLLGGVFCGGNVPRMDGGVSTWRPQGPVTNPHDPCPGGKMKLTPEELLTLPSDEIERRLDGARWLAQMRDMASCAVLPTSCDPRRFPIAGELETLRDDLVTTMTGGNS